MNTPASAPSAMPNYKIGNEKFCRVTESAATKVLEVLRKGGYRKGDAGGSAENGGAINGALRVAVVGGGCSGLQYKMDIVPGPANRDIVVPSHGIHIVVDPKSALFVSGSELDYSSDEQKGGFKVTNPNATAHCSCGESFSA